MRNSTIFLAKSDFHKKKQQKQSQILLLFHLILTVNILLKCYCLSGFTSHSYTASLPLQAPRPHTETQYSRFVSPPCALHSAARYHVPLHPLLWKKLIPLSFRRIGAAIRYMDQKHPSVSPQHQFQSFSLTLLRRFDGIV